MIDRANALVDHPNLNCAKCYSLYKENPAIIPMCKKPSGCLVGEDLASDWEVNEFITSYCRIKTLFEINKIPDILLRGLEAMGIEDDIETLIELDLFWGRFREQRSKENDKTGTSKKKSKQRRYIK